MVAILCDLWHHVPFSVAQKTNAALGKLGEVNYQKGSVEESTHGKKIFLKNILQPV